MSASANNNNGYANNNSAGGNSNINQGTPTAKEKAKFQNFEGQARLLAALVASLEDKGVKLDYLLIHKYLGLSTPDGLEYQFRRARKTAQDMRAAVAAGGTYNPAPAPTTTPKRAPAPAPTTTPKRAPAARKRAPAQSTAASRKRGKQVMMDEDEDEGSDSEYKEQKTRAKPSSRGGQPVTAAVTPTTTVRPPPAPQVATRQYPLFAPGWSPDSRPRPVSRRQTSLADTRGEVVRGAQGGQPSFLTSQQRAQRGRDAQVALQGASSSQQPQQQQAFQQPQPQPQQYPQGSAMQSFDYPARQQQQIQQQTQNAHQQQPFQPHSQAQQQHYNPQQQQPQNTHQPYHHHHNHHQQSYSPSTFASHSLSPTTPHDDDDDHGFPSHLLVDPQLSYTEQLFADDDGEGEKEGEI